MQQNLNLLANDKKVQNTDPVRINDNIPVEEELIPQDKSATTINGPVYKGDIKSPKSSNSFLESVRGDNPDIDKEFQNFRNILYETNDEKEKQKLLRKFRRLDKDKLYEFPEYNEEDSLEKLQSLDKKMVSIMKRTRKVEFLWHIVWLVCYLFELAVTKIGYGIRFNGWSEEVSANKREYEEYLRMMVSDTMAINPETGEEVIIKNDNYIAKMDISPTMLLVFALVKSAITYTGANNFGRLASRLNNSDYEKEDDILRRMPIPDDMTDTSEVEDEDDED